MDTLKVILVDDAPEALDFLKEALVEVAPNVNVLETASSVVEAVKSIQNNQPDLVFLDIDLPDGTGFDVLEMTQHLSFDVIFTTASDAHAIRAFKFSATDYLLKPFSNQDLEEAIKKLQPRSNDERFLMIQEGFKERPEKIAVSAQDRIELIRIDDIVHCESQVNYTTLFLQDGNRYVVTKTLKEYDELLSDHGFIRIHQSHLINEKHIKTFLKNEDKLILSNGDQVPVSTRKKTLLLSRLNQYKK